MSAPLPQAPRDRFQRLIEEGLSGRAAARRLQVSPATGARWAHAIRIKRSGINTYRFKIVTCFFKGITCWSCGR